MNRRLISTIAAAGLILAFRTNRAAAQDAKPEKKEPAITGKNNDTLTAEEKAEGKKGTAKLAAPKACCSCLEGLNLKLITKGPHLVPDETVEVDSDDPDDSEKIKATKHTRALPGHRFQVWVHFNTKPSEDQGNLTLQWLEKADRLPTMSAIAG